MKLYSRLIVLFAIFALLMTATVEEKETVHASSATTYTTTFNRKGLFVVTQDAYLPDRTILNLGLDKPNDLHIGNEGYIYVADTGNQRIVIYDPDLGEVVDEIAYEGFSTPKGIFITQDNHLYVADAAAEKVFQFDLSTPNNDFMKEYVKPTSVSFEATSFNPKKVAVDNQDNLYIIAEGVFDGIIQMTAENFFDGYFATNRVVLTPVQRFQNLIFTDKQLEQLVNRDPGSFSNVYVDKNGIKYSTSHGTGLSNLKKHNTNGSSSIDTDYGIDLALVDTYTDNNGIIFAASSYGHIFVFSSEGSFIFAFGTGEQGQDVSGIYSNLVSIAVDDEGRIWTLDEEKAFIQSYVPTDYSTTIYEALYLYQNGKYAEAVESWEEVLKLNQLSVIAHNEIGRNLFSQGYYEESMEHFELAGSRYLYQLAYWEVRNVGIQENLPIFLLGMIGFLFVYIVVRLTNKKYQYLAAPVGAVKKLNNVKFINDFTFQFAFLKHPLDSFYTLKKKDRGSYKGAVAIFILFFFVYMIFVTSKGFIYQFVEAADMDLGAIILGFFSVFILFVVSNYLVTSINDGEGSIGEVFKGVIYSLFPIMLAYALTTFLSYYVTYNELIVLQLIVLTGTGWTGLLIFLAIQELHNYTIRETIKSLLMTFLFMAIAGILFAFIQIMGDQLIEFIVALVKEAFRHVFS